MGSTYYHKDADEGILSGFICDELKTTNEFLDKGVWDYILVIEDID